MILSKRLRCVASLVTRGNRLADVGTDHAFVPIFLIEEGVIPSAIAMDVNPGPLERAAEHIRMYGMTDRIETRLCDGLEALGENEADTIVLAGMGGALTVRILSQRKDLCREVRELILQPQSEIDSVRRYLEHSGWMIENERMVFEDGKYYPMMRCVPGAMLLNTAQERYGPCLMKERGDVWIAFLRWKRGILENNLSGLKMASGERGEKRRSEILQDLKEIEELLEGKTL